jgi:RNA polymerase sigma-70 factor, ECF subfamily
MRDGSGYSDQQLVDGARKGAAGDFTALVRRHGNKAFTLALRIVHDRRIAEEVVQDAFLKAYRGLSGFRGDCAFTTWLYRIVYTTSLSRARTEQNRVASTDVESVGPELSIDQSPSVHLQLETKELHSALLREIEGLPAQWRAVVTLFYMEERTYEEITSITSLPMGTVKTYLFRARTQLKERLSRRLAREEVAL